MTPKPAASSFQRFTGWFATEMQFPAKSSGSPVFILCRTQERRRKEEQTRPRRRTKIVAFSSLVGHSATQSICVSKWRNQKCSPSDINHFNSVGFGKALWLVRELEILIFKSRKRVFYGDFYVDFVPDRTKDRLVRFEFFYVILHVAFVPGPIGTILNFLRDFARSFCTRAYHDRSVRF